MARSCALLFLVAFSAIVALAFGQDAVPVDTCQVRLRFTEGSDCDGVQLLCVTYSFNATTPECQQVATAYSGKADCTNETFELYNGSGCTGSPVNAFTNTTVCADFTGGTSIAVNFDTPCSSSALSNWISLMLALFF